ncbi:MAG: hypothetical protein KKF33_00780, partial [Alphaproteobacteria bacterium]|nr:hypothetical protein [Alphaproteobacteria bacterium]
FREHSIVTGCPAINCLCQKTPEQWEHQARRRPVRRVVFKSVMTVNTLFQFLNQPNCFFMVRILKL